MASLAAEGQGELAAPGEFADSSYANADLLPVPVEERTWTLYNYAALWIGMSHNLVSYTIAGSLIYAGMNAVQALMTIALGNLIVLAPTLLNSHAGTKYGIPFPVFARAFYGVRGANLVAALRGLVACGWFGVQTWVGGESISILAGKLLGPSWANASSVLGQPWTLWVSFALFWAIQMAIIWRGMDTLRRFESLVAPLVLAVFLAVLGWLIFNAHWVAAMFSGPTPLGWGIRFWPVFWPSVMTVVAFWATISLNMPDFTRFSRSQRGQALGQAIGLPTTMTFFSLIPLMVATSSAIIFLYPVWDPNALAWKFSDPALVTIGLITLLVATVSVNVAANLVSPSYDFANLAPRRISRRTGGLIAGVLGVLLAPWKLVNDPYLHIFAWLDFSGGILGAVAGVLVAGYWLLRRTRLDLGALYRRDGAYWYTGGWNLPAVTATVVGALLAVGGANTPPNDFGPFPAQGLIPLLKPLYSYSWAVGFVAGLVLYVLLAVPGRARSAARPAPSPSAPSVAAAE